VKERDGGVNEEGFGRDEESKDPISHLEEKEARKDEKKLFPLVEGDFEHHRHCPHNQRGHKEYSGVASSVLVAPPRHGLPFLSLPS